MVIKLTQVDGVPDSSGIIRGMAHFAGTGPAGTYCRECLWWGFFLKDHWNVAHAACEKHRKLTKQLRVPRGGLPPVPSGARSCKYFEARPKRG